MIKKLCIISSYYPSSSDPVYAFVGTLVEQFADNGIQCDVITPISMIEKKHVQKSRIEFTKNGNAINVYCPRFVTFPNRKIGSFSTYRLTGFSRLLAVKKVFKKHIKHCDAIYSHFLLSGIQAAELSKKTGIPGFVALGESNITNSSYAYEIYRNDIKNGFKGIICVSSDLKNIVTKLDLFDNKTPINVYPNSIDNSIFMKLDTNECRKILKINNEDFVISFVGSFIKRKGIDKLQEIIKKHPNWKCILIGSGNIEISLPKEQVIFCGRLKHDSIPKYLCASNVFVLPTLEEGCCNAIVEALACGLPVVSSDRSFNDDILDDSCSIRINPEDANEIEKAIEIVEKDTILQKKMSEGALIKASKLTIEVRARNIVHYMEECIEDED